MIICGGRRFGKTTKLVKKCLKKKMTLLVFDRSRKDELLQEWPELKVSTWEELQPDRRLGVHAETNVLIDDVDVLLGSLLFKRKCKLRGFSFTGYPETLNLPDRLPTREKNYLLGDWDDKDD